MGGLDSFLGSVLGQDGLSELKKQGVTAAELGDLGSDLKPDGLDPKGAKPGSGEMDFNLASESLESASRQLKERMGKAKGPQAAATESPPPEVLERDKRKEELNGPNSGGPQKGESMRKFTAKASQELPIIPASQELLQLLEDGQVEEFNAQRPAGRLDLSGIRLAKRNLSGIDLRYCELARADLRGSDLSSAQMQHANLDRANLEGATLIDLKAFEALLTHANLKNIKAAQGAQFVKSDLSFSELQGSNFNAAAFTEAKLTIANLERATFRGAIMSKTLLARSVLNYTVFEGALLDEARFYQARGRDVNFKDAVLVGAEAVASEFTSSEQKVDDGKILKTTFEGAWVQDFVHRGAVSEALLKNAKRQGLPPEGLLPKIPMVDQGKVLIDGLPGTDKVRYDAAMAELNQLIGLKDFKAMVPELLSHIKVSLAREQVGLPGFERKLHYVLVGPPGTGKSTCARILGKLFGSFGLLSDGHVIETDKSGFIAGYAGQTLSKTNELIDDSLGGALIADEIYALTEAKNDDYAKDAIVVLVKRLWDDRHKFAAFFLGYPKQMAEFIAANPGFDRRMAGVIEFPANSSGELVDVFKMKMGKLTLSYSSEMLAQVSVILAINKELKQERFGNAGTVENVVEDLTKRMSARLDRQGLLGKKSALSETQVDDLPSEKYAKVTVADLPPLRELRWVNADGKELSYGDLKGKGEFPNLSIESIEEIQRFVKAHGLVDIETGD